MNSASSSGERARAELTNLLPLRDDLAQRAGALRAQLQRAAEPHAERIDARALRCERLVRLLDTRIRLAAEALAAAE
jgi:hypothetical protein